MNENAHNYTYDSEGNLILIKRINTQQLKALRRQIQTKIGKEAEITITELGSIMHKKDKLAKQKIAEILNKSALNPPILDEKASQNSFEPGHAPTAGPQIVQPAYGVVFKQKDLVKEGGRYADNPNHEVGISQEGKWFEKNKMNRASQQRKDEGVKDGVKIKREDISNKHNTPQNVKKAKIADQERDKLNRSQDSLQNRSNKSSKNAGVVKERVHTNPTVGSSKNSIIHNFDNASVSKIFTPRSKKRSTDKNEFDSPDFDDYEGFSRIPDDFNVNESVIASVVHNKTLDNRKPLYPFSPTSSIYGKFKKDKVYTQKRDPTFIKKDIMNVSMYASTSSKRPITPNKYGKFKNSLYDLVLGRVGTSVRSSATGNLPKLPRDRNIGIKQTKDRVRLPPPPLGKAFGHGIVHLVKLLIIISYKFNF